MNAGRQPLRHILRVRTPDDLRFVRDGLVDELLINANQLENGPESTAAKLRKSALPFSIDPVLSRFQERAWWRNGKGEDKRNYTRLGTAYVRDTAVRLPAGPLIHTVGDDKEWARLAGNIVAYQVERFEERMPPQLSLLDPTRVLRPVRLNAPGLVAYSTVEDRVNRLLADASINAADMPVAVPVIVPAERLRTDGEIDAILATVREDGVSAYLLWTPSVTEELLFTDHRLFSAILRLISGLADRGIPVAHMHATYPVMALAHAGVGAVAHHLGWVDHGEPAEQRSGGPRSCQTYVPGVRHCVRFKQAHQLGAHLDRDGYTALYCECEFCTGAFENGTHPLTLLLEEYMIPTGRGGTRATPTPRSEELNTWHHLFARRNEIRAFSEHAAADVIARDIQRAAALARPDDAARLQHLIRELGAS
jgi:hypothetical protein